MCTLYRIDSGAEFLDLLQHAVPARGRRALRLGTHLRGPVDRDLVHLRDRLSPEFAEAVYYGFWYCAKMDALLAFIREAQQPVTGSVELNLYKGNILVKSRESSESLYDAAIASMEGGGSYDQTDAEGFLRILGLPLRVQGAIRPRK